MPSSAQASSAPYRSGTQKGLVVTWLTNTNFHCGCLGNLPTASSAASAVDAPNPAKGESEIRAPALAARRRASRRETPPLLSLGGRLILFIQVHGVYFFGFNKNPTAGAKLLCRKTISRCLRIFLTRFELCCGKVRVVWRIWKVLRLQADTGPVLVGGAALAYVCAIEKITAIKLQARFGCQDFHEPSRGWLVERGDQLQVFSLTIEHPVMIVTLSKLQLFVVVLDSSPDRSRFVEIERSASTGL